MIDVVPHVLTAAVPRRRGVWAVLAFFATAAQVLAAPSHDAAEFHQQIEPIFARHCADCHEDGAKKGNVALDELGGDKALFSNPELWWKVLKNVRSGLMPPAKEPRLDADEMRRLVDWIKFGALQIDAAQPDPGRVTLRRLNRVEYRNTIRDLMGIDYNTTEEFPPDDSGYGFDTIGDALSVSPLLLEKYMQAAQAIVDKAVPRVARIPREQVVWGHDFNDAEHHHDGRNLTFYEEAEVSHPLKLQDAGHYVLKLELVVNGAFDFDPGRCSFSLSNSDHQLWEQQFDWADGKKYELEVPADLPAGQTVLSFKLHPLVPADKKKTSVSMHVEKVRVVGPMDEKFFIAPDNYTRFFTLERAPAADPQRADYARQVLTGFAAKAFRRPPDTRTVDRLLQIAQYVYTQPNKSFEDGIAQAMIATLASPRFLFRLEQTQPGQTDERFAQLDEYALASRLSYFLWSTMPDQELMDLASRKELRKNLSAQVRRMLNDGRSDALVRNFTGQWLELRDVDGVPINSRVILRQEQADAVKAAGEDQAAKEKARNKFRVFSLDGELRTAIREEPEKVFSRILHEDRSVIELITGRYTYLNERLAKLYGMPDVSGNDMRLVNLPDDSVRGGLLTDSALLMVTSNPTRTSPVKRGQFILDNILGMPAPPPPPDIPPLEAAQKKITDHPPTFREVLELHRSKPLCASCHSRMDPLGLALENFNALGMWREKDKGQPIDPAGRLMTGEQFGDIRELKKVIATEHKSDFYRCLTEKLMTYALGRGIEYYDVESVDRIVDRLDREDGKFSVLLDGIINSTPFQQRRTRIEGAVASRSEPTGSGSSQESK